MRLLVVNKSESGYNLPSPPNNIIAIADLMHQNDLQNVTLGQNQQHWGKRDRQCYDC